MGITVEQYRASIGRFGNCKFTIGPCQGLGHVVELLIALLCIYILLKILLSGDVELNPGPELTAKTLCICQANLRGLNYEEMLDIKASMVGIYDIICLTETHLHSGSTVDLQINGFQPVTRLDRKEVNHWGGIAVFVSEEIVFKRRVDLEVQSLEALWLECRTQNNRFLLCCTYRTPNMPVSYWEDLQLSLDLAKQSNIQNIVITGDLNSDQFTNPNNYRRMTEFSEGNHLTIHVKEPTRITSTSKSILDQFITTLPHFVKKCEFYLQ